MLIFEVFLNKSIKNKFWRENTAIMKKSKNKIYFLSILPKNHKKTRKIDFFGDSSSF